MLTVRFIFESWVRCGRPEGGIFGHEEPVESYLPRQAHLQCVAVNHWFPPQVAKLLVTSVRLNRARIPAVQRKALSYKVRQMVLVLSSLAAIKVKRLRVRMLGAVHLAAPF